MLRGRTTTGLGWSIQTLDSLEFDAEGNLVEEDREEDYWHNGAELSGPGYRYDPEQNVLHIG